MYEKSTIGINLSKLTVKLRVFNNEGTGIIYIPVNSAEKAFIITAKHCILGHDYKLSPGNADIQIFFHGASDSIDSYFLSATDSVLLHGKVDIAIIIIDRSVVASFLTDLPKISIVENNWDEKEVVFYGFPKAFESDFPIRANGQLLPPITNGIVSIESGLKSENNLTEDTVVGFSGSGIGLICSDNVFLLGIITEFEEWGRFKGICVSFINDLLRGKSYPIEPLTVIETNPSLIKDCQIIKRNAMAVLNNISNRIGDISISRAGLVHEAITQLADSDVLIVYGIAGIGKSGFVKELLEVLAQEGTKVVGFHGAQICKLNSVELLASLNVENTFDEFLDSKDFIGKKIVYIDSAEKSIENNQLEVLKEILELVRNRSDLKVIMSIRSYALSQTTFNFIKELSVDSSKLEVVMLTNEELQPIMEAYPKIKGLFSNVKIEPFIRTPFYLKQILSIIDNLDITSVPDESSLKVKLWELTVRKDKLARESLFQKIAINRAKSITPFILVDNPDVDALNELLYDNILVSDTDSFGIVRYAPAHDILEDWALVRYIQSIKIKIESLEEFYSEIGHEYAIRRGFRFWLQELYRNNLDSAHDITLQTLHASVINEYWKDEVLTALLNSSASTNFFKDYDGWILSDEEKMFTKMIHLLRTACKAPANLIFTKPENKAYPISSDLIPVGSGWCSMIEFICKNYEQVKKHELLIIRLLLEWSKGVTSPINAEAKFAVLLVLEILEDLKPKYKDSSREATNTFTEELIKLLFKLVEADKEQVQNFLSLSVNFLKDFREKGRDNRTLAEFYLEDFHEKVIALSLSWQYSEQLARFLPELVCEIAEFEWIKVSIPKQRKSTGNKDYDDFFNDLHSGYPESAELSFGLNSKINGGTDSSAYQTPVHHLLKYHPGLALDFIVHIINKTFDVYITSKRGREDFIVSVKLTLQDKTYVTQHGSQSLWSMYRGTVANTPYLLESMMMALEKWMLNLCSENTEESRHALSKSIQRLFKESKSVSTTAVVASVSMAYPFIVRDNMLPLFSTEEFFIWDIRRFVEERHHILPSSFLNDNPEIINERKDANDLPHRKERLEHLAFKMSFYDGFSEKILSFLDKFYRHLKDAALHPMYDSWPIILNRIDKRRYKVTGEGTNENGHYVIIEPEIPEAYKETVEEAGKLLQDNSAISVWNWTNEVLKKNNAVENTWEKWLFFYKLCRECIEKNTFDNSLYNNPAGIAYIGLCYYEETLDEEQTEWCVETVAIISQQFSKEDKHDYGGHGTGYSPFNKEFAYISLPLLLKFELPTELRDDVRKFVVEVLFNLSIGDGLNRPLFEKVAKSLWEYDALLASNIFNAFVYFGTTEHSKSDLQEFEAHVFQSNATLPMPSNFGDEFSHRYNLDKAFLFITEAKDINTDGQQFIENYLALLIKDTFKGTNKKPYRSREGNEYYQGAINFWSKAGKFFLEQEEVIVMPIFLQLIGYFYIKEGDISHLSNESFKFGNNCLREIILYQDRNKSTETERFSMLWKALSSGMFASERLIFLYKLLLDIEWKDTATTWPPVANNIKFYESVLMVFGAYNMETSLKLVAGIGFETLFPESLPIIDAIAKQSGDSNWAYSYQAEKYVQRAFYLRANEIKTVAKYKTAFLNILDTMIQHDSSIAYLIRESFNSL